MEQEINERAILTIDVITLSTVPISKPKSNLRAAFDGSPGYARTCNPVLYNYRLPTHVLLAFQSGILFLFQTVPCLFLNITSNSLDAVWNIEHDWAGQFLIGPHVGSPATCQGAGAPLRAQQADKQLSSAVWPSSASYTAHMKLNMYILTEVACSTAIQVLFTNAFNCMHSVAAIVHAKITFLYGERLCKAVQEEQQFQDRVCSEAANRNKDPGELIDEGLDLFF
ncbi:hypothetical protein Anapl_14427 [Anas platyrhynchos]|uniref:Uncharacterized protein n=1 Tax=Anas platyrhynchos TaxID=8839 RepID=R0LPS5_ANAPL|nr:hypothetical protein Anapl_14427 [Anas platyrhynchos]